MLSPATTEWPALRRAFLPPMRFLKPSRRALALATFAGLAVAVLTIRKGTPTMAVAEPPASASLVQGANARAEASQHDASFVEAAPSGADAHDAGRPEPACLAQAMTTMEPHARWLARFDEK